LFFLLAYVEKKPAAHPSLSDIHQRQKNRAFSDRFIFRNFPSAIKICIYILESMTICQGIYIVPSCGVESVRTCLLKFIDMSLSEFRNYDPRKATRRNLAVSECDLSAGATKWPGTVI